MKLLIKIDIFKQKEKHFLIYDAYDDKDDIMNIIPTITPNIF